MVRRLASRPRLLLVLTRAPNAFSQQEELLKCDDEEELKSIYHMLDRNRDGGFSHAEIRLVFNEIGGTHAEITDEEINEMIWEADMSGDGEICYKEFCKLLARVCNRKIPPENRGGSPFEVTLDNWLGLQIVPLYTRIHPNLRSCT